MVALNTDAHSERKSISYLTRNFATNGAKNTPIDLGSFLAEPSSPWRGKNERGSYRPGMSKVPSVKPGRYQADRFHG